MKIEYSTALTADVDLLVRVYPNQSPNPAPKEGFAGEILVNPRTLPGRDHVRFTAEFPRGLAEALKEHLPKFPPTSSVRISNEIPDVVGDLTSCRMNFHIRFENEVEPLITNNEQPDRKKAARASRRTAR